MTGDSSGVTNLPTDGCRAAASAAHIRRRRWPAQSSSRCGSASTTTMTPLGFSIARAAAEEQADVGDVLDHFHRQHDVEALAHAISSTVVAAIVDRGDAPLSACTLAAAMLRADASMPMTCGAEPGQRLATAGRRRSRYRACAGRTGNSGSTLRSKLRQAASRIEPSRSGLILCSGAILPLGSHQSSDSFENWAISAGSGRRAGGRHGRIGLLRGHGLRRSYRAVMWLRNFERRGDRVDGFLALADAENLHVAIIQDTARNALNHVDTLRPCRGSSRRSRADETLLVDDAQIGDVGLGGPAVEPGAHRLVQRENRRDGRTSPGNSSTRSPTTAIREGTKNAIGHDPAGDRRQDRRSSACWWNTAPSRRAAGYSSI